MFIILCLVLSSSLYFSIFRHRSSSLHFVRMESYQFSDRDEAASPVTSCGDQSRNLRVLLPFSVAQYIEQYSGRIAPRRFSVFRMAGVLRENSDVSSERLLDTAVGACINQWWRLRWRGVTNLIWHYPETDSPYVRYFEELGYEEGSDGMVQCWCSTPCWDMQEDPGEVFRFPGRKTEFFRIGVIRRVTDTSNIACMSILGVFL